MSNSFKRVVIISLILFVVFYIVYVYETSTIHDKPIYNIQDLPKGNKAARYQNKIVLEINGQYYSKLPTFNKRDLAKEVWESISIPGEVIGYTIGDDWYTYLAKLNGRTDDEVIMDFRVDGVSGEVFNISFYLRVDVVKVPQWLSELMDLLGESSNYTI